MQRTRRNRLSLKRRKSRKLKGGTIVGSGTTSITIHPAIPCEGINVSNKVSKVFKKESLYSKAKGKLEHIIEELRRIDPDRKHFIYPEFCETPGELTDEIRKDFKAADMKEENKTWSYLMDHGGVDLETLFSNYHEFLRKALEFFKGEDLKSKRDLIYEKFKPLALKLHTNLALLHSNQLYHNDLHLGNLVCNDEIIKRQFEELNDFRVEKKEDAIEFFKRFELMDTSETNIKIIDWDAVQPLSLSSKDYIAKTTQAMKNAITSLFPIVGGEFAQRFFDEIIAGTVSAAATGGSGTA
jgi:hypothetical protein